MPVAGSAAGAGPWGFAFKHGRSRIGCNPHTWGSPSRGRFRRPARERPNSAQHPRTSTPSRSTTLQGGTPMSATNINRVVLTGNLTRDPELRSLQSGTSVCSLRIASNARRRSASGEWVDKPNYFSVTVWGAQGENCARFLSKGRPVCIDGRLDWRQWTAQDNTKRESVEIVAESVQFLGSRDDSPAGPQPREHEPPEPAAVGSAADDDGEDIPL